MRAATGRRHADARRLIDEGSTRRHLLALGAVAMVAPAAPPALRVVGALLTLAAITMPRPAAPLRRFGWSVLALALLPTVVDELVLPPPTPVLARAELRARRERALDDLEQRLHSAERSLTTVDLRQRDRVFAALAAVPLDSSHEALTLVAADGEVLAWAGEPPPEIRVGKRRTERIWSATAVTVMQAVPVAEDRLLIASHRQARRLSPHELPRGVASAELDPGIDESEVWTLHRLPPDRATTTWARRIAAIVMAGVIGTVGGVPLLAPFALSGIKLGGFVAIGTWLPLALSALWLAMRPGRTRRTLAGGLGILALLAGFDALLTEASGLIAASASILVTASTLLVSALPLLAAGAAVVLAWPARLREPARGPAVLVETMVVVLAAIVALAVVVPEVALGGGGGMAVLALVLARVRRRGWALTAMAVAIGVALGSPALERAQVLRRQVVEHQLSAFRDPEGLEPAIDRHFFARGRPPDLDIWLAHSSAWPADLAQRLWDWAGLERLPLAASVEVFDGDGRLRSTEKAGRLGTPAQEPLAGGARRELAEYLGVLAPVFHREWPLLRGGQAIGQVVIHLAEWPRMAEGANIVFTTRRPDGSQASDAGLELDVWPPPAAGWTEQRVGSRRWWSLPLVTASPQELVVSIPADHPVRQAAVLALLVAFLVTLAAAIGTRALGVGVDGHLWESYGGRLALAFVLVALLPIGLGAALARRSAGLHTQALATLQIEGILTRARATLVDPSTREIDGARLERTALDAGADMAVYRGGRRSAGRGPDWLDARLMQALELGDRERSVEPGAERTIGAITLRFAGRREILVARPWAMPSSVADASAEGGVWLGALALLAVTGLVSRRVADSLVQPLRDVGRLARRLGRGQAMPAVVPPAERELRLLVESFLAMAGEVQRREQALVDERQFALDLIAHLSSGLVALDTRGFVLFANPRAADLAPETVAVGSRPTFADGADDRIFADAAGRDVRVRRLTLPRRGVEVVLLDDVSAVARAERLGAWAEMARIVAHEVKNPLTPIRIAAEHLEAARRRGDPRLEALVGEVVERILKQVEQLRRLANEFQDLARAPAPAFAAFDFGALVREVAAAYAGGERRIELRGDCGSLVGDRRLLHRALVNLLENAVAAVGDDGTIEIIVSTDGNGVEFRIGDDGPGVAPADWSRLFEPTFSTKSHGTGLGLALVARAAEAHGGAVQAARSRLGGLEIALRLPMRTRDIIAS